jgi:hypothetical protein
MPQDNMPHRRPEVREQGRDQPHLHPGCTGRLRWVWGCGRCTTRGEVSRGQGQRGLTKDPVQSQIRTWWETRRGFDTRRNTHVIRVTRRGILPVCVFRKRLGPTARPTEQRCVSTRSVSRNAWPRSLHLAFRPPSILGLKLEAFEPHLTMPKLLSFLFLSNAAYNLFQVIVLRPLHVVCRVGQLERSSCPL